MIEILSKMSLFIIKFKNLFSSKKNSNSDDKKEFDYDSLIGKCIIDNTIKESKNVVLRKNIPYPHNNKIYLRIIKLDNLTTSDLLDGRINIYVNNKNIVMKVEKEKLNDHMITYID